MLLSPMHWIINWKEEIATISWLDDEEQFFYANVEEEQKWYEEEVPSHINSYYFTLRDDGYSCEKIYE